MPAGKRAYPEADKKLLRAKMMDIAKHLWDIRRDWVSIDKLLDIDRAFELADTIAGQSGQGVVFLNDTGDNPTGSGVGDSAYMLGEAIKAR